MKSCLKRWWLHGQQNHRAHKERRDKYWAARRKQYLAAERRKQRLENLGPVAKARMERKEIARRNRKYNAYQGARGILISMNAWAKPQAGTMSVKAMLAVGLMIAWMLGMLFLPLMFMSGLLGIFAQKLFDLPGLKQITQLFLKIACSKISKAIGDKLTGDQNLFWFIPSPSAIIGKLKDVANSAAGAFSDIASAPFNVSAKIFKTAGTTLDGVPIVGGSFKFVFDKAAGGAAIASDVSGGIAGAVPSLIEAGMTLAETGIKALKQLQNFSCMLEAMFEDFKHQGLADPFRASISCANWPSYLGSLKSSDNSTASGLPKYCVDNRKQNDAQSLVPAWLKPIYQAAAQQYNIPWELLAAINWNDTEYGAKEMNADQKKHPLKADPKNSSDLQALDNMFGISTGIPSPDPVGQKFLDYYNLKGNAQIKAKDRAKGIIEAATQVVGEWQQPNNQKLGRAGWIPLSQKEWDKAGGDWGYVPPDWKASPYGKSAQACPMPVATDGSAVAGGTPLPAQDIGGAGVTTKGQNQFAERLAAITGLDVNLVKGWALAEMSGSYALGREASHNYNWLNIGYYDSLHGGGAFQNGKAGSVWSNPVTAADATAAFLEGHFLGASPGIQHILRSAGKSVATQIDYIAKSGWASSGYGNGSSLRGTYKLVKHTKQPARIKVKWRNPKTGKMFTLGDGSGEGGSFVASNAPVNVSFVPDGNGDTCDPVDSIFATAHWLSINGAQGDSWTAALVAGEGILNKPKVGGKVTVVGDELADDNKDQLKNLLIPSPVDFQTASGLTTPQAVRKLRELGKAKKLAPTVVMSVGNNNLNASAKDIRTWIRGTMGITGPSRCVVWPTVWAGGRSHFVGTMLQAEKNYDNLVVVRWDKYAKKYIDKADPKKFHTNDQGIQRYSELIAQAVSRCSGGTSQPNGTGMKVDGRASSFGVILDNHGRVVKLDPNDTNADGTPMGVACAQKGVSHMHPGIAVRPGPTWQSSIATKCGWWWLKSPKGKAFIIQQIDVGPNQSAGRRFDLNDRATKLFGYKGRDSFPTDEGTWHAVYLGKHRPPGAGGSAGSPARALSTKPPRSFRGWAMPPIKYLKQNNKSLPAAAWRHAKADPLSSPFPSFDSGLSVRPMAGDNCNNGAIAASQQMQGLFYAAAHAFAIPWQLLSAYAAQYSIYGCQPGNFSSVRPGYEMDASGDGVYNPADPIDAVFSNARSLASLNGSSDPASAVRKLTADPKTSAHPNTEMLMKIAYAARQLGYNSMGMVKLLDDGIGIAVDRRDHVIDKSVCADQSTYVECIASLYRKIMGVEDSAGTPGGWLTGGCMPPPVPDTALKPYSLNSQARRGAASGAYTRNKNLKGVYSGNNTWARKDALAGEQAAIRTFESCNPKYSKNWKSNVVNDWGSGFVNPSWDLFPNGHLSHRNGADNDLNIAGPTDMTNHIGPYNRKLAKQLGRMLFRAGAVEIYFNDPAVQNDIAQSRAAYLKQHPDARRKLGARLEDKPMFYQVNHDNHFHIRWYLGAANSVPADVKVWITNQSVTNLKPQSSQCKKRSTNKTVRSAGPWAKSLDASHPCSSPPTSGSRSSHKSSNPLGPYGKLGKITIPGRKG